MASRQAQKRLNKEYKSVLANPPPFIVAKPTEESILEWHYVITGPPKTPYENGQYHGTLRFPSDYPFKPPSITMLTPNGRFTCNMRLCLSMSDYHPDTWNPAWSVLTILTGLLSFMTGNEHTTGSIFTTNTVKRKLAADSKKWNSNENLRFAAVFPELNDQNKIDIKEAEQRKQEETSAEQNTCENAPLDLSALDPEDRARFLVHQEEHGATNGMFSLKFFGVIAAFVAVYFAVSL